MNEEGIKVSARPILVLTCYFTVRIRHSESDIISYVKSKHITEIEVTKFKFAKKGRFFPFDLFDVVV